MKFKIVLISVLLLIVMKTTVYAAGSQVDVKVNGEIKNGKSIEILFNVKDVSRLYAGSIELTYDPSAMKVESINGGEFIKTNNPKIMEFGGETAKNGNIADYYFTCVGKVDGFTGSGGIFVVKANILNQDKFNLYKKNIKIQLVERNTNNEMKDITYTISGDVKDETPPKNSDSQAGSSQQNSGNNTNTNSSENSSTTNETNKDGSSGANSSNTNSESGKSSSNEVDKSENKGFVATIIDKVKSIFNGSSNDDKKDISNSSVDNDKKGTSGGNSGTDSKTSENNNGSGKKEGTTNTSKSNQDTLSKGDSKISSNASKNNSTSNIVIAGVIFVLLTGSGVLYFKKFRKKK